MNKKLRLLAILGLLLVTTSQAHAGIFSRIRNWANTGWNSYGYGCPCYNNGYYGGHRHGFFNNGAVTGFTPPVFTPSGIYPGYNHLHNPINMNNQFNHLPNGMNTLNTPTQMITDFNSNVGTRTGVTILD